MQHWAVILVVAAAAMLGACSEKPKIEGKIIGHVVRPGGGAEAVITDTTNGGATISNSYRVYVKQIGEDKNPDDVLRAYRSYPPTVRWMDKRTLIVSLPCGEVDKFVNAAYLDEQHQFEMIFVKLENNKPDCW